MSLDPAATAEGYLTVGVIDRIAVRRLRDAFDDLDLPRNHAFHATSADGTREAARSVDRLLKTELGPVVGRLLPRHVPFLAAFISKGARAGGMVDFHQDWTYTDERRGRAILFWIPLVDTNAANGTLRVVPGSHRWTRGLRASGATHATDPLQSAFARRSVLVEVEAGSALVYDPSLVHGSLPNATRRGRPVAAIAVAPAPEPLVHFHVDDRGDVGGWVIDESHFTTRPFASRPEGCEPIEPWDRLVSTDDFTGPLAR